MPSTSATVTLDFTRFDFSKRNVAPVAPVAPDPADTPRLATPIERQRNTLSIMAAILAAGDLSKSGEGDYRYFRQGKLDARQVGLDAEKLYAEFFYLDNEGTV